jgi:hypothetical protein
MRRESRAMKIRILAGILVLLASVTHASGYGEPSNVDIIVSGPGDIKIVSAADDIKIATLGKVEDLELVGSQSGNITIISGFKQNGKCRLCQPKPHCRPLYYAMCENPECYSSPKVKSEAHVGADAWHGTYWFADNINTPKWPLDFGGSRVPIY